MPVLELRHFQQSQRCNTLQQLQTHSAAHPVTNACFNMIGKLVSVLAGPEACGCSAVGHSVNHPIHFGPDKTFKGKLIQTLKFFHDEFNML